jgi:hypothetical protein
MRQVENFSGRPHDLERDCGAFGKARAAEIAEFTMFATEAVGRVVALEAAHTFDAPVDAPMVLFQAVI